MKLKKEPKRLFNSFKYAFNGIKIGLKEEANMKIHFIMMILVLLASYILNISITELIICLIMIGLVISFELINTAIEATVDLVTKEINSLAKTAKDTAAAGVFVISIIAAIVGLIIFIPKLWILFM